MSRHLATIQKIDWVQPIEGKDRIMLCGVLGWQVICTKDLANVGEKVVFAEIDSVFPEKPEFEFLRSKNFRIRTMKMAGTLSQGICFPLSILPSRPNGYNIGDDVTEIIGIHQYEPTMDVESNTIEPAKKAWWKPFMRYKWFRKYFAPKKVSGAFPSFISKTDETRIQNIPAILSDKSSVFVATEKVDGCSGSYCLVRQHKRFGKDKFEFIVCSRNMRLPHEDNTIYWQIAKKYHIEEALKKIIGNCKWVAIQGECIGPRIQGNKYKVNEPDFFVFNLIYSNVGRAPTITAKFTAENIGLKFVPIVYPAMTLPDTVQEMLDLAHGQSQLGDTLREGLVIRSDDGKRSFKAVDPLFLLKYNE